MGTTLSSVKLEPGLLKVEQLLEEVSVALISGEPLALEVASSALRQSMLDIARLVQSLPGSKVLDVAIHKRLEKVSFTLAQQRENLIRRAVVVDRALQTVLPQAQPLSTYSGAAKWSGYRGGAARIYAAVAN